MFWIVWFFFWSSIQTCMSCFLMLNIKEEKKNTMEVSRSHQLFDYQQSSKYLLYTKLTWHLKPSGVQWHDLIIIRCAFPLPYSIELVLIVLTGRAKPMILIKRSHQRIIVWWLQKCKCATRHCKVRQSQTVHITKSKYLIVFHVQ